ncbi:MAG: phosphate acyltransferase PlsX, partial [Acidimicrobiia bacterium]
MGRACTVAVDAMGGDRAPGEIVAGALQAAVELDVGVLLVGQPDAIGPLLPSGGPPAGVEVVAASEIVAMHDDPASSVRTKKDSSLARAAGAVRDGRAQAMVGAGNTGATMASALLRWGRIKGISRPGIAVPIPVPGAHP